MGRFRDWRARAFGDPGAEFVGKIMNVALAVAVLAIVAAIVIVGYFDSAYAVRQSGIERRSALLFLVVFGIIAFAVIIAVAPMLMRSVFGEGTVWWTNVFRLIALAVLVVLIASAWPLGLASGIAAMVRGGAAPENGEWEPVGLVPDPPEGFPADLTEIRREAIRERYWRLLARWGDGDLMRRYRQVRRWRSLVTRYATAAGLDPARIEAVVMTESAGEPHQTSRANARGLLQVLDDVARMHAPICGFVSVPGDSYDPEKNICAGVSELRAHALERFPGDWENALAAYNWGIGNLSGALGRMDLRFPGNPRSFWALWDKADPTLPPELSLWKRTRNPEGRLLLNYGTNPDETRHYVPTVLAWEYIIRHIDEHGRPPPRDGMREPPTLLARRSSGLRAVERGAPVTSWYPAGGAPILLPPPPPPSNVWYTARAGESFGGIVVNVLHEDAGTVALLNPDIVAAGLAVAPGTLVRLPEERYAFHHATGRESYLEIARRYGMTTAELLRWAGRWNPAQAWRAWHRDCPPVGCDDERAFAAVGEHLLVRRK